MTFNSLPAYEEPGDIASTGDLAIDMGYDPQRHWEAGDRPADVFVLGDFQSSLGTQNLNLDQISQVTGSDLSQMKISEVPFLQGRSVAEVAEATPALKDFTMEEIPALDGLGLDSSMTLGEAMEQNPSIGEMDFSAIAGDSAVTDVPNLDLASMESFEDWQATAISEVPGLGDIPMGSMPNGLGILSGVWAKFDMPYGPKEHTKTPTKYSITGSNKDGFTVQCVQSRGCAHIELEGFFQMHGAQWISGGTGPGQQMVNGGEGILGATNGGKEPTGRHPYGDQFKVVLSKVVESEGSAEFSLYFKYCYRGIPDLGCTPYFLGPVPMPVLDAKEKGLIITGILDGQGGLTSGLEAPESWSKKSPDPPKEVQDILDKYAPYRGSGGGGGSLCGDGPGGINFQALSESIHGIESSGGGDSYTTPGGLYVDGRPRRPRERGYALGRYQYMSYREDVAAIISAKPGGAQFLSRTFNGQQPTREEISKYFSREDQDALFVEDQSKTIQSLLDQGYSGDRILEILGQIHFGGSGVLTNGTLDSTSTSDGYGRLSLWDYGQQAKENYYAALKSSGEDSKCGKSTGTYRNPTAGYKPHDGFNPKGIGGRVHKGVDVGGRLGDPLFAADGGTVRVADHGNRSWGLHIVIQHEQGKTLYGHLDTTLVRNGDRVAKGDKIGTIGSSGRSSGPHLHFEVSDASNRVIDPDSVVDWNDY